MPGPTIFAPTAEPEEVEMKFMGFKDKQSDSGRSEEEEKIMQVDPSDSKANNKGALINNLDDVSFGSDSDDDDAQLTHSNRSKDSSKSDRKRADRLLSFNKKEGA